MKVSHDYMFNSVRLFRLLSDRDPLGFKLMQYMYQKMFKQYSGYYGSIVLPCETKIESSIKLANNAKEAHLALYKEYSNLLFKLNYIYDHPEVVIKEGVDYIYNKHWTCAIQTDHYWVENIDKLEMEIKKNERKMKIKEIYGDKL